MNDFKNEFIEEWINQRINQLFDKYKKDLMNVWIEEEIT